MKTNHNEELSKYTTIRIGGTAENFFVPESIDELKEIMSTKEDAVFIGGRSNLLISERSFKNVVLLREFNKKLEVCGNGMFKVGASVRLQKLINTINEEGYGGMEYLFSVPGLVGGAIVMNAGRGKTYNQCISDYVCSVTVLKNGNIIKMDKSECNFGYRNSVFKNNTEYLVLEVEFMFPKQSCAESLRKKNERIELCKRLQDNSKANFGTVFCESNNKIMKIIKKTGMHRGNASFSKKTQNWIVSDNAKFQDILKLIKKVQRIHRFCGKKAIPEVIIWE